MQRKLVLSVARRVLTWVVACLAALAGGVARAQAPRPPIVLVLDPCARVDAQEVRRLVPIEMGAPLAPGAGDPRDTTRVSVGCVAGAPQVVRLEVRDPTTGRTLERVVNLEGMSKTDQARLVAIASVELVAASQGEPGHASEAASLASAAPTREVLTLTATPKPLPPRPRWRVLALGSLHHFAGLPTALLGGGVAVERALPHGLGLTADVTLEDAAQSTALGAVDARVMSFGLVGSLRVERGRFAGQAGVGARGGDARLAGEGGASPLGAVLAKTVSAPWVGPVLAARATVALGRAVVASLGGELGYVTSDVVGHVDGQPDLAVRGLWWGASLGVGLAR